MLSDIKEIKEEKTDFNFWITSLKKEDINNSDVIVMPLSILYAMNFLDFKEPYICVKE